MSNEEYDLYSKISQLDKYFSLCGKLIELGVLVINQNDKSAARKLIHKLLEIQKNEENQKTIRDMAYQIYINIFIRFGQMALSEESVPEQVSEEDHKSLEELLSELKSLVGLERVKEKVNDLIIYQKVQKMRSEQNLHSTKGTMHLAFTGNPGTGKTTVARIIGCIYKQLGLLSKGHFIEVSRTDLIAGYQGQTALKVKKVIDRAKGGVLFIDEAYSITENDHADSYGRECLTELTKALEDYRDDLVVIVAGYTQPMNKFFESNPGLKSRFNTFIEFPDYTSEELEKILNMMCQNNDYYLSVGIKVKIKEYLDYIIQNKNENFANARLVRNLYDDLIMNQARRVVKFNRPTRMDLSLIVENDFPEELEIINKEKEDEEYQ